MIFHFNGENETEKNIRICWAINNAVQFAPKDGWKGKSVADELSLLKMNAYKFLEMFDEMKKETEPVCESCHGISTVEKVGTDGLHASCRKEQSFKKKDL